MTIMLTLFCLALAVITLLLYGRQPALGDVSTVKTVSATAQPVIVARSVGEQVRYESRKWNLLTARVVGKRGFVDYALRRGNGAVFYRSAGELA